MATNLPTYATVNDLRDVYPNINKYDTKQPLYNWVEIGVSGSYKLYQANNSGLTNVLFRDGEDLTGLGKKEVYTDSNVDTSEALDSEETGVDVADGSAFSVGNLIKIDSEIMLITKITSNTLTVIRGFAGTSVASHVDPSSVFIGLKFSINNQWFYSTEDDCVLLYTLSSSDPNDSLLESGEDWLAHKNDLLYKASRYFDSYVDASLPQRMHKNSEGEYPYLVIRTTAQICAYFLISAHDPENEDALRLKEEYEDILDKLVNGQLKLDYEKSSDSAKGVLTELFSLSSTTLKPLDIIGTYTGSNYDKILIKITTGGGVSQAKFTSWVASDDNLGAGLAFASTSTIYVQDELINGQYQNFASGLYVRFGCSTTVPAGSGGATTGYVTGTTTAGDAYQVEVFPRGSEIDDARGIKSARLTRA